ncbi:hypothetical protein A9Q87_08440 [Flavobacteriales bacterium 34_180_T64]|nr:hypothetical protein A9Q87_08440 [Flavobacteriales bacterium 34_180_T64]
MNSNTTNPLNFEHFTVKKKSFRMKSMAIVFVLIFTFIPLSSIDSNVFTTNIMNFNFEYGCFGCWPIDRYIPFRF